MNMDTTSASTTGVGASEELYIFNTGYVSCMRVDGQPILPPLMTDKRREEMRRYREQAIAREKELKDRPRISISSKIPQSQCSENSETRHESTASFERHLTSTCVSTPVFCAEVQKQEELQLPPLSPPAGGCMPVTSTPRVRRTFSLEKPTFPKDSSSDIQSPSLGGTSNVPDSVLKERTITIAPLDLNKTFSSVPSGDASSALSYDGDVEKGDAADGSPSESDDHQSEDNFASAASSAGTFVINRASDKTKSSEGSHSQRNSQPREPYTSSEEEQENSKRDPPPTVLRKPSSNTEDHGYKRKRPAKYFDLDDEIDADKSKCSAASTTFSSIPNRVPESTRSSLMTNTSAATTTSKFSPVAITNFSSLARSLTMEFTKKFCPTSEYSSSASTIPPTATSTNVVKVSGGSYDVRLSKEIPSSAEEDKPDGNDDAASNSSDKENIDTNANATKHVRKLSYTLATPSAVLLEAVSKSHDKQFTQTLETVPSAPSSVGIQSAYPTPEKAATAKGQSGQAFVHDGSGDRNKVVAEFTSGNLSTLSLGQGKQAHLERYLGEQEDVSKTGVSSVSNVSPRSVSALEEMHQVLKKMQEEHEAQLRRMAEQHRLQELKIRQEFESEMDKLKEKFSSTLNTTDSGRSYSKASPNSMVESVGNSLSARSANNAKSPVLPTSTSEELRQIGTTGSSGVPSVLSKKESSVYHFTGGNSTIGDLQSSSTSTFVNSATGTCEISAVGLSKLQSRMQLMSPRIFRTPADARSPLLKGLVFLDPLDKPAAPLRIPQKALDPQMKPKFDRISAAVKGFLIRRLLNTEKVQIIVQTIRDTVDLLLKLYEEAPVSGNGPCVKPQDSDLHQRLIQQLTGACRSFHDVFFKLSTKERMAIIATDREKLRAKALRNMASPAKPNISNATLKSIERRMSHRTSPKRDNRKSRSSKAYNPYQGSQSVKPKSIKIFNISPKRRRISYWDDRNSADTRPSPNPLGKSDVNGNNFRVPSASRTQASSRSPSSARSYNQLSGFSEMGETFIVPSSLHTPRSALGLSNSSAVKSHMGSGRKESITPSSAKTNSARSTISSTSLSSGVNKPSRASISKQPWNPVLRK